MSNASDAFYKIAKTTPIDIKDITDVVFHEYDNTKEMRYYIISDEELYFSRYSNQEPNIHDGRPYFTNFHDVERADKMGYNVFCELVDKES